MTAYPELEGLKFFELDPRFQRHIENRTIRCLVILKETHPQVKFDVFERLNSGSVKLTPQELRHGIYYGDMVVLCEDLAKKNKQFGSMISVGENKRMKLEELVLRFLALRFEREHYKKPLSGFLNSFAEKYRSLDPKRREEFSTSFNEAVDVASKIYGQHAFQLLVPERRVVSRFNSALFDAEMQAASSLKATGRPLPAETTVLDTIERLFANEDSVFRRAVVQATSDEVQVKARIEILSDALNKL